MGIDVFNKQVNIILESMPEDFVDGKSKLLPVLRSNKSSLY